MFFTVVKLAYLGWWWCGQIKAFSLRVQKYVLINKQNVQWTEIEKSCIGKIKCMHSSMQRTSRKYCSKLHWSLKKSWQYSQVAYVQYFFVHIYIYIYIYKLFCLETNTQYSFIQITDGLPLLSPWRHLRITCEKDYMYLTTRETSSTIPLSI